MPKRELVVGVLAVQGAVSEHVEALQRAAKQAKRTVRVIEVKTPAELRQVSGLVLPGGESTTISRLLRSGGLQDELVKRAQAGTLALFGTCAGLILLSDRATHDVVDKDIQLLRLLDCEVDRNAFGRQKDSFESNLEVKGIGQVAAVFIRAPVVTQVEAPTEILAKNKRGVVAVQKGLILGAAFHPELSGDDAMHIRFLDLAAAAQS